MRDELITPVVLLQGGDDERLDGSMRRLARQMRFGMVSYNGEAEEVR